MPSNWGDNAGLNKLKFIDDDPVWAFRVSIRVFVLFTYTVSLMTLV